MVGFKEFKIHHKDWYSPSRTDLIGFEGFKIHQDKDWYSPSLMSL